MNHSYSDDLMIGSNSMLNFRIKFSQLLTFSSRFCQTFDSKIGGNYVWATNFFGTALNALRWLWLWRNQIQISDVSVSGMSIRRIFLLQFFFASNSASSCLTGLLPFLLNLHLISTEFLWSDCSPTSITGTLSGPWFRSSGTHFSRTFTKLSGSTTLKHIRNMLASA